MAATPKDYEILGLPDGTEKATVERKYGALLRAYKRRTDECGVTDEDAAYYQRITEAYDNIVGTVHDFSDPNPTSILPFKFRNFFYKLSANLEHHKFIITGVVMIAIIVTIVWFQIRDVSKDDMNIKFVGAYNTLDIATVEQTFALESELVNSPSVSFFTVSVNTSLNDQQALDASVQFRLQFTTGAIDVILIDKDNYDVYLNEYVFLELTDFLEANRDNPAFANLELYTYENKGDEDRLVSGVYGIDVTESAGALLKDSGIAWLNDSIEGKERSMILTICRLSQNEESTLAYAAEFISDAYAALQGEEAE